MVSLINYLKIFFLKKDFPCGEFKNYFKNGFEKDFFIW